MEFDESELDAELARYERSLGQGASRPAATGVVSDARASSVFDAQIAETRAQRDAALARGDAAAVRALETVLAGLESKVRVGLCASALCALQLLRSFAYRLLTLPTPVFLVTCPGRVAPRRCRSTSRPKCDDSCRYRAHALVRR